MKRAHGFSAFSKASSEGGVPPFPRETLIKSLSDFILGFLYRARNHLTRIASYLRRMMTKLCIKIHMKSDSAIESAFPEIETPKGVGQMTKYDFFTVVFLMTVCIAALLK